MSDNDAEDPAAIVLALAEAAEAEARSEAQQEADTSDTKQTDSLQNVLLSQDVIIKVNGEGEVGIGAATESAVTQSQSEEKKTESTDGDGGTVKSVETEIGTEAAIGETDMNEEREGESDDVGDLGGDDSNFDDEFVGSSASASLLLEGTEFDSFEAFTITLQQYSNESFVQFACNDSSTIESRQNAERYNPKIVYTHITFNCTYGGKQLPRRGNGIRNSSSRKTGCPVKIRLSATSDGQRLVIRDSKLNCHNHEVVQDNRLRHLDEETELEIYNLICMHENKRLARMLVRDKLVKETGKEIQMKEINNIEKRVENKLKKLASKDQLDATNQDETPLEDSQEKGDGEGHKESIEVADKEESEDIPPEPRKESPSKKPPVKKVEDQKKPLQKRNIAIRPSPLPTSNEKRKNAKRPVFKEEDVKQILKDLKEKGSISEDLQKKLRRPVSPMPGSPSHIVANQVANRLSHVPECNINTSTKDRKQQMKKIFSQQKEQQPPRKIQKVQDTKKKTEKKGVLKPMSTSSETKQKKSAPVDSSPAVDSNRPRRHIKEPNRFRDQMDLGITSFVEDKVLTSSLSSSKVSEDTPKKGKEKGIVLKSPRVSLSRVKVDNLSPTATSSVSEIKETRGRKRKRQLSEAEEEKQSQEEKETQVSEADKEDDAEPEEEVDSQLAEDAEPDTDRRAEIRERKLEIQEELLRLEQRKMEMLGDIMEKLDIILEQQKKK